MTITIRAALATGVALLLAAGCSGSTEGSSAGGSAASEAQPARGQADRAAAQGARDSSAAEPAKAQPDLTRDVIQTAQLTVHTERIGSALAQARAVVRGAGGVISAEQTSAATDGEEQESVLTLRVPAGRFADVLDQLAGLGTLQEQQTSSEDVTLQVIDVEARIASAEQALVRLRELLDRAQSLSDVVTLENELLRREADLEALKGQQAYLADQTSLSTITLTLLQPPKGEPADEDAAGFLGGLGTGWGALLSLLGVAATTVGVLLPFLVLLGLLLVPTWLLVRRTRVWSRSAN